MPECTGYIAIAFHNDDTINIEAGEELPLQDILLAAGINMEFDSDDVEFFVAEEVTEVDGFTAAETFGQNWTNLAKTLTTQGKDVEVYATFSSDCGTEYYYALGKNGDRFAKQFNSEGDLDEGDGSIHEHWVELVPDSILEEFGLAN